MRSADRSSKPAPRKQTAAESPSSDNSASSFAKYLAWPALLLVLVFAVYSPSLKFSFILDDHRFTGDPRIQESGHVFEYFSNYVWAQFTGGPPSFYRPVFLLWLRLCSVLAELSPWGWHLLSIAKHLLVAIVLWFLICKLLGDRLAAFAAAALFALHPSHTESVSWTTVPDPLLTLALLFSLLSYLIYVESRDAEPQAPTRKSRKTDKPASGPPKKWLVGAVLAYFAALLTKETAIIFPAVILILAAVPGSTAPATDKGPSSTRQRTLRHIAVFAGVTLVYFFLRWNALSGNLAPATQHLSFGTLALSWPAILWFYVKVLLWPVRAYSFADPILIDNFSVRGVLLPLLGLIAIAGLLAAGWIWAWGKTREQTSEHEAARIRFGLVSGLLLLVLPLLLTLNLNALNPGDFLHGRYVYLPLAGLSMLVAIGIHLAQKLRLPLLIAAGIIAIVFVPLTWSQERQWQDDSTVFTVGHRLAPNNRPVAKSLANTRVRAALLIADEGRCSEAMPVFNDVASNYPDDWYAWAGRGICYVQSNDLIRAEEAMHRAADLSHDPTVMQQWQALREHMGLPNSLPPK